MNDFVAFFTYLSSTPLFGLTATLGAYVLASAVYARLDFHPWANPVLWSVAALSTMLVLADIPYPRYFAGAQFIHFLLGPAVVALAWPLWLRRQVLWQNMRVLLLGALAGGVFGGGMAVALGWALGLPPNVLRSLTSKAITAPVAMGIAQATHGIPELAAVFVLVTGLMGAILGQYVFRFMGLRDWPVQGFALGTQAHGFGTAWALQMHPDAGAYAGLAMGLQAVLGSVLIPLLIHLIAG